MRFDSVIRAGTAVLQGGAVEKLDIAISDGRIAALLQSGSAVEAGETIEAGGLHVLPGIIDAHLHPDTASAARGARPPMRGWRVSSRKPIHHRTPAPAGSRWTRRRAGGAMVLHLGCPQTFRNHGGHTNAGRPAYPQPAAQEPDCGGGTSADGVAIARR